MIPVPTQTTANGAVRVWLATGHTDMRKGFMSLDDNEQPIKPAKVNGGTLNASSAPLANCRSACRCPRVRSE